ncbi:hypothetical protein GCM10023317_91330 [Actinopolymorpha pittospori]
MAGVETRWRKLSVASALRPAGVSTGAPVVVTPCPKRRAVQQRAVTVPDGPERFLATIRSASLVADQGTWQFLVRYGSEPFQRERPLQRLNDRGRDQ